MKLKMMMIVLASALLIPVLGFSTTINLIATQNTTIAKDNGLNDPADFSQYLLADIRDDENRAKNGLVLFDLSGMPSGVTVTGASLSLYEYYQSEYSTNYVTVSQLTQSWDKSTANWFTTNGSTPWTTPGADGVRPVSQEITAGTNDVWFSWDVTSIVTDWLAGNDNFGFKIYQAVDPAPSDEKNQTLFFASLEYNDSEFFPKLTIDFDSVPAPSAAPEPGTMILFGFGLAGLAGIGRKKRQSAVDA